MHNNRRAVSNVVLMLGVVICIAVLLIGGFLLVTKFIDAQARADPEYLTTELITLINTVQTAPETITFQYYTETDENGFPVIGSLEINDDTNQLCISKKTEDEIFSTILTRTAIAAGFGGVDFAYGKSRSAAARKATSNTLTARAAEDYFKEMFPTLSENPSVYSKAMENTLKGDFYRKYLLGQKLTDREMRTFDKMLEENPAFRVQLRKIKESLTPEEKEILAKMNQPGRFRSLDFVTKYANGVSVWFGEKVAKVNSWLVAGASKVFPVSVVKAVGGTMKVVKATGKEAAFIGAIAAGQTWLTGGGWEDFKENFKTLAIYAIVPKIIEKLLTTETPKFLAQKGFQNPINQAYERVKDFLVTTFPPGAGEAGCLGVHVTQVLSNVIFSVWDWYMLDSWLIKIWDAAGDAASAERDAMFCENFLTQKQVLLTPPNCKPKYESDPALTGLAQGAYVAAYGTAAVLFAGATYDAKSTASFTCGRGGIREKKSTLTLQLTAGGIASAASATTALIYQMSKNPLMIIPKTSCDPAPNTNTCDTTYLRQDCPNWFVSTQVSSLDEAHTRIILGLLQGGPACTVVSIYSGWGGMTCNAARLTAALSIFFLAPQDVYLVMLRTDQVGLTKEVNEPKTALGLDKEFANNDGFWYAELPYVIEMTKIYTNDTTLDARTGHFVIRKT